MYGNLAVGQLKVESEQSKGLFSQQNLIIESLNENVESHAVKGLQANEMPQILGIEYEMPEPVLEIERRSVLNFLKELSCIMIQTI